MSEPAQGIVVHIHDTRLRYLPHRNGAREIPEHCPITLQLIADGTRIENIGNLTHEPACDSSWFIDDIALPPQCRSFKFVISFETPNMDVTQLESSEVRIDLSGRNTDTHSEILGVTFEIELTYRLSTSPSMGTPLAIPSDLSQLTFADIDLMYQVALVLPDDDPEKPRCIMGAGILFRNRFLESKEEIDICRAIDAFFKVAEIAPDSHPVCSENASLLDSSLSLRIEAFPSYRDETIAFQRSKCAGLTDDSNNMEKFLAFSTLGDLILQRFRLFEDPADIDSVIEAHTNAFTYITEGDFEYPGCLNDIANAFLARFARTGNAEDIDKAIEIEEKALKKPEDHPDHPSIMNNFGNAYLTRYQLTSNTSDLSKATSIYADALQRMKPDDPERVIVYNSLGSSLTLRFDRFGDVSDIDKAIESRRKALVLFSPQHPEKHACLNNLGTALFSRFERSNDFADIDEAINAHMQSLLLLPDNHAARPIYLTNLGNAYLRRFEAFGDREDIDKTVSYLENAVRLTPDSHSRKPETLNSLANALSARGGYADVERVIDVLQDAIRLSPAGHTHMSIFMDSLARSYRSRFQHSEQVEDIDKAVALYKRALFQIPDDHSRTGSHLARLGGALFARSRYSNDPDDISQAIATFEQAIARTPDGHASKPLMLEHLGEVYVLRFHQSDDLVDLRLAIPLFREAACSLTGAPSVRLRAGLNWARFSHTISSSASLEGYSLALDLLALVAWVGRPISARHNELVSVGDIAQEAAAAAIMAGRFDIAMEWLEQGRSVVWGQLRALRTPVDELRAVDAGLADELERTARALECASTNDLNMSVDQGVSPEVGAQRHRGLAREWDALVERTRAVEGFEDFLRPVTLKRLTRAAHGGPVVVVNVHWSRCDALILNGKDEEVMHLPLDLFSFAAAQDMQQALSSLLVRAGARVRDTRAMKLVKRDSRNSIEHILSNLWFHVAKPVLDCLGLSMVTNSCDLPRLWWCLTGPLTFLPLHAAGIYNTAEHGCKLTDFVVPSYTPTLTMLLEQSRDPQDTFSGLLAISQPATPGQLPLPETATEIARIRAHSAHLPIQILEGPSATIDNVIAGMSKYSWVHLACHATQDVTRPTASAFCLQDGPLALARLITESFPHADFAFLSACQTATGDENLSEEAVHLAAGMLLAGYRGVIATMWSIMDSDAPVVADEVYKQLLVGQEPDSTQAARALHYAVMCLREKNGDAALLSWVPFIHVGL